MARKRRKQIKKTERLGFGREENEVEQQEEDMMAEAMKPTKKQTIDDDDDDSEYDPNQDDGETVATEIPSNENESKEDQVKENTEPSESKPEPKPATVTDSDKENQNPEKSLEEENEDVEDIDVEAILKKDTLDAEDVALLNLAGHGAQEPKTGLNAFADSEARDGDDDAEDERAAQPQDEHEAKFGVVKDLISKKRNVETDDTRNSRRELDALRRAEEDDKQQKLLEKVFIEGQTHLLKGRNGQSLLHDKKHDSSKEMKFTSRDATLKTKTPEDFITGDAELDKDCYDENGEFLEVWKIRLNRENRFKIVAMEENLSSDDEEYADKGLSKEERRKLLTEKIAKKNASNMKLSAEQASRAAALFSIDKNPFGEDEKSQESEGKKSASIAIKTQPKIKRRRKVKGSFAGRLGSKLSTLAAECERTEKSG
eukprot:UN02805